MFESKSGILLVAGIGFFALAFLSNGLVPWLMYAHLETKSVETMIADQKDRPFTVVSQLKQMREEYRDQFKKYYPKEEAKNEELTKKIKELKDKIKEQSELKDNVLAKKYKEEQEPKDLELIKKYKGEQDKSDDELCAKALRVGHKVYVAEACWHCHSQFVRPVSNEEKRWGKVSKSIEYQNEFQMPVMFGTRRVGPDLTREGGRRSNDWHAVHFFNPRDTSPRSVMPKYPWLFDGNQGAPNDRGIGLILYMQWLNSWSDNYPYRDDDLPETR